MLFDLPSFIRQSLPPSSRTPIKIALARMLFAPILYTIQAFNTFRTEMLLKGSSNGQVIVLESLLNAAIGRSYLIYILDGNFKDVDFQVVVPSDLPGSQRNRVIAVLNDQHLRSKRWSIRTTDEVSWRVDGNPSTIPFAMIGLLESVNATEILGWAADANRFDTGVWVLIYIDDVLVEEHYAGRWRPEIGEMLGDYGFHGISYKIPDQYKTVGTHTVDVKFMDTMASLPGSPKTYVVTQVNQPDPLADFRIFAHWDGFSQGLNILALVMDNEVYSGRIVPEPGQQGTWPSSVDLKPEQFIIQTANGAVTANRRYLFHGIEKVPAGTWRVEVWRKLYPNVKRVRSITLSGIKFEDEITPVDTGGGGGTVLAFSSGYPKLNGSALLWAVTIAGTYLTRVKRNDTTIFEQNLAYVVGEEKQIATEVGYIYRVEVVSGGQTISGEVVTAVDPNVAETAFNIPRVNGLDTNVATVTRSVVGGEIRYSITPQNVQSGYVGYIIVNNIAYTSYQNVAVGAQRFLDVLIVQASDIPSNWWQYKFYDGVTNPSAEYTRRSNMVKPGHQFSIETGLPTN
ncbi:hypothetical protein ACO2Q8_07725 [Larkinella sp. VNQ87]|uniref:hypothetical protein n=1 Tax=Larkinella sp. VNQ87 TaxID=3400921 RepID=UPI003C0F270E